MVFESHAIACAQASEAWERASRGNVAGGHLNEGPHVTQTTTEIRDLSSLLDAVERKVVQPGHGILAQSAHSGSGSRSISVGAIVRAIGHDAHGPLLLAVGLISISPATLVPGSTWALAAVTLLIALQMALQKDRAWMPRRALRIRLSQERLADFIQAARPAANAVDRVVRPRWRFLSEQPWIIIIALMCALAALITFPLGLIPFAPLAPGLAIVLFGLGLTARDGVLLAAGMAVLASGLFLVLASLI